MELIGRQLTGSVSEAVLALRTALAEQGFGTLTEIDMAATLKAKIGVDVPDQVLLGVCNPVLAHGALEVEPSLGVLLPCTLAVRETGEGARVDLLDPTAMVELTGNPELKAFADEAVQRLTRAMDAAAGASS